MIELENIIFDFLRHCQLEKNLSVHSLKAYQLDLNQFRNYLFSNGISMDIKKIDKVVLRRYLQQLVGANKIKTVKRKMATLKALFNYLDFEDKIEVNPFRKMRLKIKEPFQLPGVLTVSEIKKLFQVVYKERQECQGSSLNRYKLIVRDIVVLELLFATGTRVSELCNLKTPDVNLEQNYIKVNGKGSRERIIQVCSTEIHDILKEYWVLFHPEGSCFTYFFMNRLGQRLSEQSVRFMIKKYARLSNLGKKVTPHMFRHSFATLLLEEEVDIRYIQQLLGHSTITTTQIYTHITQQKQKAILTTRHPRTGFHLSKKTDFEIDGI